MTAILFPKALYKIIETEAGLMSLGFSTAVRHIVQWHRGAALPRNPASPKVKAPKVNKRSSSKEDKIKKSIMLDDADHEYIDKMALPYGLTRQAVIVLILMDWLELSPLCTPKDTK